MVVVYDGIVVEEFKTNRQTQLMDMLNRKRLRRSTLSKQSIWERDVISLLFLSMAGTLQRRTSLRISQFRRPLYCYIITSAHMAELSSRGTGQLCRNIMPPPTLHVRHKKVCYYIRCKCTVATRAMMTATWDSEKQRREK